MNKFQIKLLLVVLMNVTVIGGYSVYMMNNTRYLKSQPTIYVFKTGKIDAVNKTTTLRSDVPHSKSYSRRSGNSVGNKSGFQGFDFDKTSLSTLSGSAVAGNSKQTETGRYGYTYRIPNRNNTVSGENVPGMSALGLLASSKKTSRMNEDGTSSMPASLASTTYDTPIPGDRQFARGGNGNGGGHAGKDPFIPVGDGVWVMLLFSAAYLVYRKKLLAD